MRAETLLRKLCLQQALSDDELNTYLGKLRPDGSLPPNEILILLELLMQRTERLSVEDIKAVSGLANGGIRQKEKAAKNGRCKKLFQNLHDESCANFISTLT